MPFTPGQTPSIASVVASYTQGATAKQAKWVARSLSPHKNPIEAAKASTALWLQRVNEAGTAAMTAGLSRVDQNAMADTISKSGPAYAAGVTNKAHKFATAMTGLLPAIEAIRNALPPRGDIEANIIRSAQQQRNMAALRGKHRG